MAGVRERMIEGALRLLARRGLQATSFSEVVELTGTPRGSIYHHFPLGKDELVVAALDLADGRARQVLEAKAGQPAAAVTDQFLLMWRTLLERSGFRAGCAVLAVTVATESPELLGRTGAIFREWRAMLARLLEQGGLGPADAAEFAAILVATCEGAVVLCRAEQSIEPFDLVSRRLLAQVAALAEGARRPG